VGDFGCVRHEGTGYLNRHLGQSLTEGRIYRAGRLRTRLQYTNWSFRLAFLQ